MNAFGNSAFKIFSCLPILRDWTASWSHQELGVGFAVVFGKLSAVTPPLSLCGVSSHLEKWCERERE